MSHKGVTIKSNKTNTSDSPVTRMTEIQDKKDNYYDSSRTDSGFLSGGNLVSETYLSEEISHEKEPALPDSKEDKICSKSYSRLDSGVDVGLSNDLSKLCIQESFDDLGSASSLDVDTKEERFSKSSDSKDQSSHPWDLYFEQDEDGDTQLHIAVIKESIEVVYSLIKMVPSSKYLDIRNEMRQTALHLAVLVSAPRIVKLLVAAGAKTNSVDHHGNTPLHLAVAAGDLDCVRELTQPLPDDVISSLGLKYKPSKGPSIVPELNMFNYEGVSCVHLALAGGHLNVLKHLVWFGADIDSRECKSGKTVLHMAAEKGDVGLVLTLVRELRADPCPLTYAGESPYKLVRGAAPQLENLLLSMGACSLGDSDLSDEEHLLAHQDSDEELDQIKGVGFRDLHLNGGIITA